MSNVLSGATSPRIARGGRGQLTSDGDAFERDRVADHVGPHGAEGLLPALVEDGRLLWRN